MKKLLTINLYRLDALYPHTRRAVKTFTTEYTEKKEITSFLVSTEREIESIIKTEVFVYRFGHARVSMAISPLHFDEDKLKCGSIVVQSDTDESTDYCVEISLKTVRTSFIQSLLKRFLK